MNRISSRQCGRGQSIMASPWRTTARAQRSPRLRLPDGESYLTKTDQRESACLSGTRFSFLSFHALIPATRPPSVLTPSIEPVLYFLPPGICFSLLRDRLPRDRL